jgi:nitrogen regulatory protein PII
MKKLEATIDPFELDDVKEALVVMGVDGMTISEVRGLQRGEQRMYRGVQYSMDHAPKIKVEVVVRDEQVVSAVEILERATRARRGGDDRILVLHVEDAIRIRTGEHGTDAICHIAVSSSRAA